MSGTALFTMPAGPIKCAGAPQKIAYLAADWWRSQGVLDRTRVILVLPTAAMFSRPDWAKVLEGIAAGYGIEARKESQLTEVDGDSRQAVISGAKVGTKETIDYGILHATPPRSAPDWLRQHRWQTPRARSGMPGRCRRRSLAAPPWFLDLGPVCRVTKGRAEPGSAGVASFYAGNITWVASCGRVADDTAVFG